MSNENILKLMNLTSDRQSGLNRDQNVNADDQRFRQDNASDDFNTTVHDLNRDRQDQSKQDDKREGDSDGRGKH